MKNEGQEAVYQSVNSLGSSLDHDESSQSTNPIPSRERNQGLEADLNDSATIPCPDDCLETPTLQAPTLVDGSLHSRPRSDSTTKTSVDAVHPLFTSYRNIKCDKSTSTDNQMFFCHQCSIYIDLSHVAVNQHFSARQHSPIEESCVYCQGAVYEYFYNENQYYYHQCLNETKHRISDETISKGRSSRSSK